ncbi:MAG TPA: c-type cytochrome [Candidatus Polarisedimenticolia bacterium]|nr:c-type cytochrome [Candidatus Polarisedimenticolia bacterium]
MRWKTALTGSAALVLLLFCGDTHAQESHVGKLNGNEKRGKALYGRYCIFCHGRYGDGRGESAPYLDPKPRDFTKAVFKCRSTPSGSLPLDSDLYDTISRGVHDSGMPSWKPLLRQERVDLIAYIKTFSSAFQEEKPGAPVEIPPEPPSSAESIRRGAQVFESMNCWSCHGKDGRGHGPSAAALTDSKGYPITPFDFTSGSRFKCGETDRDMFRDLITGLDGTPMPSFASAMTTDQRWDVVHYLRSLSSHGTHAQLAPISQ